MGLVGSEFLFVSACSPSCSVLSPSSCLRWSHSICLLRNMGHCLQFCHHGLPDSCFLQFLGSSEWRDTDCVALITFVPGRINVTIGPMKTGILRQVIQSSLYLYLSCLFATDSSQLSYPLPLTRNFHFCLLIQSKGCWHPTLSMIISARVGPSGVTDFIASYSPWEGREPLRCYQACPLIPRQYCILFRDAYPLSIFQW
jgi:hypothetical protein